MAAVDMGDILSRAGPVDYITQEVIFGGGEPVQPSEYTANGNVQEYVLCHFEYIMNHILKRCMSIDSATLAR